MLDIIDGKTKKFRNKKSYIYWQGKASVSGCLRSPSSLDNSASEKTDGSWENSYFVYPKYWRNAYHYGYKLQASLPFSLVPCSGGTVTPRASTLCIRSTSSFLPSLWLLVKWRPVCPVAVFRPCDLQYPCLQSVFFLLLLVVGWWFSQQAGPPSFCVCVWFLSCNIFILLCFFSLCGTAIGPGLRGLLPAPFDSWPRPTLFQFLSSWS